MLDEFEWNDSWETADRIPVWAVACMSIGARPGSAKNSFHKIEITWRLNEAIELLSWGFRTGEFQPDQNNERFEREGRYERSFVSRTKLRAFYKDRKLSATFLTVKKFTYEGYWKEDAPLVERMRVMIQNGKARSVPDAALAVEGEAMGSKDSRAKRLERRFVEKYPECRRGARTKT